MHPVLFHAGPFVIPSYGALAAIGVLFALVVSQCTARIVRIDPNYIWNLCIIALFSAIVGSRVLLVIVNWTVLRSHPSWLLGLAMVHHPLLAAAGAVIALIAAALYARWQRLPPLTTADALAAPVALGLAFEQIGALFAGSGYGTGTHLPWAVVYRSPIAARWSGAPIGIPVHPVQAYAAIAFLTISLCLLLWLPNRRQQGDVAGTFLIATGVTVYVTEFWRDPIGRGAVFNGVLKGPQIGAILLVCAGSLLLLERDPKRAAETTPNPNPASREAPHA